MRMEYDVPCSIFQINDMIILMRNGRQTEVICRQFIIIVHKTNALVYDY